MDKVVAKTVLNIVKEAVGYNENLDDLATLLSYTTDYDKLCKSKSYHTAKTVSYDKLITSMLMLTGYLPL